MAHVPVAALAFVLVLAVASRPLELWLWRSGRISARTLMLLMIGRFPVLVAIFGFLAGGSIIFVAFIEVLLVLPMVLGYQLLRYVIGEPAASPEGDRTEDPHRPRFSHRP